MTISRDGRTRSGNDAEISPPICASAMIRSRVSESQAGSDPESFSSSLRQRIYNREDI